MSSLVRASLALVSVVVMSTAAGCATATPEPEPSSQGASALAAPTDGDEPSGQPIGSGYFEEDPDAKTAGDEAAVTRSGCWVTLHECEYTGFGTCTANGNCSYDRMRSACASLRARYCGR